MSELLIDTKQFKDDGYVLIPRVFSASEIEQFRQFTYEQYEIDKSKDLTFQHSTLKTKAQFVRGDLLSKDKLQHVLLDDRVLKVARTLLGGNDIVYFGDSSYQIGTGSRGFHRDNIDRTDLAGPDWQGDYSLLRIGIYLQNHKDYSGGLKIIPGSHKAAKGKAIFIGNETGDVVVWNLRTLHSGNAVRLKLMPESSINNSRLEGLVPRFLKQDQEHERISFFMTFALHSSHLDRYINEYSLKRQEVREHLKASVHCYDALQIAGQKRVEVLRLLPEQIAKT